MKNKRKILSILLTLAMVVGLLPTFAFAAPGNFPDVPTGEWYYNDVQKAANTGLINGYPDGTFGPNQNMKYSEAVKLAACMHQKHTTGSVTLKNGNPWYQTYVDYAKAHSIISKNYPWESNATRAGYVEIFAHALPDSALEERNTVLNDSIPDVKMSHPQASSIYKLYRAGVLTGNDSSGTFLPNNNIRRCEVAAILIRMMDPSVRKEFTLGSLTIDTQPSDITVEEGSPANFRTSVIGGREPYTFEWHLKKGVTDVPVSNVEDHYGHDLATLVNMRCTADYNNAGYYCIIYDDNGKSVKTRTATLTVTTSSLVVTSQPMDVSTSEGEDATFTVAASGGKTPYTYEWRRIRKADSEDMDLSDWSYLSGSRTDTLTIKNLVAGENGDLYYCIITDANNKTVTSDKATLTVSTSDLTGLANPAETAILYGEDKTFYIDVSGGNPPYTFQWYYCHPGDDTFHRCEEIAEYYEKFDIEDSGNRSTLTVLRAGTLMDQNGSRYYCKVTDKSGNTFTSRTLLLHVYVSIKSHPKSVTVPPGYDAIFSVEAACGTPPYTYEWHRVRDGKDEKLSQNNQYWYVNTPNLTVKSVAPTLSGVQFYCVVKDTTGRHYTSKKATLTVE